MKCASGLSTSRNTQKAASELIEQVKSRQSGATADLAFVFASPHHLDALDQIGTMVRESGLARHILGCSGESIIGDAREVEGSTAISLWTATMPGTELVPVRIEHDDEGFHGWNPALDRPEPDDRTMFLLGDPFQFPADEWLKSIAMTNPGLRVCGGMASGASMPGGTRIMLDGKSYTNGAVGMLVDGPARIRAIVSQGCRPIGRHLLVTSANRNVIEQLGRRPAVEVLREIFETLDPADQAKVQESLHVGVVINEYQDSFGRGDFLVRNVMGANDQGGIAITDHVRVGQTVQFHLRDAETAHEDLVSLLARDRSGSRAVGALVFSCNGRGSRLFAEPDHDATAIAAAFGPIPTAGLFAMGEIGPVGGKNFVHGYTASIVLFEES